MDHVRVKVYFPDNIAPRWVALPFVPLPGDAVTTTEGQFRVDHRSCCEIIFVDGHLVISILKGVPEISVYLRRIT